MTESVQNLAHPLTSALDKAAIARILHGLVTVMEWPQWDDWRTRRLLALESSRNK